MLLNNLQNILDNPSSSTFPYVFRSPFRSRTLGNATIIFIPYYVRARSGTSQSFFLESSPTAGVLHIRHRGSGARLLDILNGYSVSAAVVVFSTLLLLFGQFCSVSSLETHRGALWWRVNLQSFLIIVFISCFLIRTKNRKLFVNDFERTILESTYWRSGHFSWRYEH